MIRNRGKRLNQYVDDYVVFDLETTGIRPGFDRIIEISAVRVRSHKVTDQYSTLVNPQMHIPETATAVNRITDKMVKGAPGTEEALQAFLNFIGDDILVGHNIHTFDMNFICGAEWKYWGQKLRMIISTLCIWQGNVCLSFPTTDCQMYRNTSISAQPEHTVR